MLNVTSGNYCAGIGGGYKNTDYTCGNIRIEGGVITAQGGNSGSGIGTDCAPATCGDIIITGGTITAKGGSDAAGIGAGNGNANPAVCGAITIANTVTKVTATKGENAAHSIGKGNGGKATCGTVTIGGTKYWENNAAVGDGATYLAEATIEYPAPPAKPDLLSGVFSVSASKKVKFSKGNLRYASGTWSFFNNQYDYYTSYSANAWDKFGWSTSAPTYGMNTSTTNSDYSGDFVDWGATMGDGWFTLTSDEWKYLFNTRTVNGGTGSGKSYTMGQSVNGKLGVVFYPDNYTGEVYSGSDWATFESAGCVFLPTAGYRGESAVGSAGTSGYYWSATPNGTGWAYYVYFDSGFLNPASNDGRSNGCSVRLVQAVDPLAVPLTIEAITAGSINVSNPKAGMQYSKNGGAKTAVTTDAIEVAAGDKVQFYGNGTSITSYGASPSTKITGSGDDFTCKVYGNIMSLVNEENFATATTLSANQTFNSLFNNNTTLTDASGLLLPATQLLARCYYGMFQGCTALTTAPALPATQLAESCYYSMFEGCSALTAAPELPATTLAPNCYYLMFKGCTALTAAPALPATQLANRCYREMFYGCSALTASPVLPAETLVNYCYYLMFEGCSKLATVTCLATSGIDQSNSTYNWLKNAGWDAEDTKTFYTSSTADWPSGNNGIPNGWERENVDN